MDATGNEFGEAQYYGCCVVDFYNRDRPHLRLGPGIPDPPSIIKVRPSGHQLTSAHRVTAKPILGGLHHEYGLRRLRPEFVRTPVRDRWTTAMVSLSPTEVEAAPVR